MPENDTDKELDQFYEIARSLEAHPHKAQILIEVHSEGETLDKALAILKDIDVHPILHHILQEGDPAWVLLHLSVGDMREAVFKLTEAGFIRLKGINSLNSRVK